MKETTLVLDKEQCCISHIYKKKLAFSSVSMSKLEFCAEFLEKIVHVKWPYTLQRQIDDGVSYLGQVTRQLKVMQST